MSAVMACKCALHGFRIAEGTWTGSREKAPAAMCRKVAKIGNGGAIEVWGDGIAVRSFTYVSDMVDAIYLLMHLI